MFNKRFIIIYFLAIFYSFAQITETGSRIALVIGNANYVDAPLENPINDAELMDSTLRALNFSVILETDIESQAQFKKVILKFAEKRENYDHAFVYYAGHAVQIEGKNYLLPTKCSDCKNEKSYTTTNDITEWAINVQKINKYLTSISENSVNILVLDACRNNPYIDDIFGKVRGANKNIGLAKMESQKGSLIAFSTEAGEVADDGDGKNSLYTKILSENLLVPNIEIKKVFQNVRTEMSKLTGQVPEEYSKLVGEDFILSKSRIVSSRDRSGIKRDIFSMFYNVENLFDTIDNRKKNDDSFLPNSDKKWNTSRYNNKIYKLSKVFESIKGGDFPELIGLAEVENKLVIEDLLKEPFFKNKHSYSIIHQESPDLRGIDCALLVDTSIFQIKSYDFIPVKIPDSKKLTREVVYAELEIYNQPLHVFVNHWPSRWGGKEETERKRIFVANLVRDYIDDNINSNESIIIMGDFNDYPTDNSIGNIIEGLNNQSSDKARLVNLMLQLENTQFDKYGERYKEKLGSGSYFYKGLWGFLDQIIVSKQMYQGTKSSFVLKDFGVFYDDFILYCDENGNNCRPNRTYGGPNWYGGFSDHLPVYSEFQFFDCFD
ncbi:MAG: hypothetical protein CMP68_02730 [Flavobacteriales bacterium]|nr:hypothetical protein [Flavobacteriales bacterium]